MIVRKGTALLQLFNGMYTLGTLGNGTKVQSGDDLTVSAGSQIPQATIYKRTVTKFGLQTVSTRIQLSSLDVADVGTAIIWGVAKLPLPYDRCLIKELWHMDDKEVPRLVLHAGSHGYGSAYLESLN